MFVVIASSNKGKIKEFKKLLPSFEILTFKEILGDMDIVEDANTFQGNAIIKAKTIYDLLKSIFPNNIHEYIVISDDSGISVPALQGEPGIYSARYAGENASDNDNNQKLISNLKDINIDKTPAFYTACIAIIFNDETFTTHGWMHGNVITSCKGEGGFGYDCMFIPKDNTLTLAELDDDFKKSISHRAQALSLALKIIKVITRTF